LGTYLNGPKRKIRTARGSHVFLFFQKLPYAKRPFLQQQWCAIYKTNLHHNTVLLSIKNHQYLTLFRPIFTFLSIKYKYSSLQQPLPLLFDSRIYKLPNGDIRDIFFFVMKLGFTFPVNHRVHNPTMLLKCPRVQAKLVFGLQCPEGEQLA
jgi:hypothetical protein